MSAATVRPNTMCAAFRRAARDLAAGGVVAELSAPTCCRSCATGPKESGTLGTVVGYRFHGGGNVSGFSSVRPAGSVEWLGWDVSDGASEADFLMAVARAFQAAGFVVTLPADAGRAIGIAFAGKEVPAA